MYLMERRQRGARAGGHQAQQQLQGLAHEHLGAPARCACCQWLDYKARSRAKLLMLEWHECHLKLSVGSRRASAGPGISDS